MSMGRAGRAAEAVALAADRRVRAARRRLQPDSPSSGTNQHISVRPRVALTRPPPATGRPPFQPVMRVPAAAQPSPGARRCAPQQPGLSGSRQRMLITPTGNPGRGVDPARHLTRGTSISASEVSSGRTTPWPPRRATTRRDMPWRVQPPGAGAPYPS